MGAALSCGTYCCWTADNVGERGADGPERRAARARQRGALTTTALGPAWTSACANLSPVEAGCTSLDAQFSLVRHIYDAPNPKRSLTGRRSRPARFGTRLSTSFDLRRVKLRSGEEYRDEQEVELEPFALGGQRYLPVPERVAAELTIDRASTAGTSSRLALSRRVHGPCQRCLGDAVVDAGDRRARVPGDESRRVRRAARRPYVADDRLDLSRVGPRRARARAPRADPLPPRLRRPLPGVRRGPERASRTSTRRSRPTRAGPLSRSCGPAQRLLLHSAAAHGRPEEENVEVPPRQAPRAARHRGAARERVPELRPAEAAAPRLPDLQDVPRARGRAAPQRPAP